MGYSPWPWGKVSLSAFQWDVYQQGVRKELAANMPFGMLYHPWRAWGILCHGPWLQKSSDMNLTVLCRAIDHAFRILAERGVRPPAHICVQTDNTTREQRNQHTFLFFCWAVAKGLWGSASPMFYLPGHSHNECDQRFVPVAAALMRSDCLQTPDDI